MATMTAGSRKVLDFLRSPFFDRAGLPSHDRAGLPSHDRAGFLTEHVQLTEGLIYQSSFKHMNEQSQLFTFCRGSGDSCNLSKTLGDLKVRSCARPGDQRNRE